MDFKNLSGTIPAFTGDTLGKLLPDNIDCKYSKEEFAKMQECAKMLEKYVSRFPQEKNGVKLSNTDMERWKNDYFKNLVHGGPHLLDDQFYTGVNDKISNLGIGIDRAKCFS